VRTSKFDFDLAQEFNAQQPIEPRDASRLMVLERCSREIEHAHFRDLGSYLRPNDLLVLNETRVLAARLYARKQPGGGRAEILLLQRLSDDTWEVLVGGKGLMPGRRLSVEHGPDGEIIAELSGARRVIQFDQPIEAFLPQAGHVPLPPYIHQPLANPERYQTVYSQHPESSAAPTAGLHFTPELINRLKGVGIRFTMLTLRVGLDTFAPVTETQAEEHQIHTEWCRLPEEAAKEINSTPQLGGRVIAVGTTSVRTIESAVGEDGVAKPFEGATSLYILPGYRFRGVDAMITNFHLPKSTLIMLVSAFAGREVIMDAYDVAKREGYRFFSFGDAMLIL
jgi:S-adenosylmethionine:tRNA ribosyltransferase-isomerase